MKKLLMILLCFTMIPAITVFGAFTTEEVEYTARHSQGIREIQGWDRQGALHDMADGQRAPDSGQGAW